MSETQDNPLRAEKRKKLHALKEKGINPFPYSYERTAHTADILKKFEGLQAGEKKPENVFNNKNFKINLYIKLIVNS